jgi:hypothetical protein
MSTISNKSKKNSESSDPPLIYYRSREQIEAYRRLSVEDKLNRLEMMAEFLYFTMPEKAKRIVNRNKNNKGLM